MDAYLPNRKTIRLPDYDYSRAGMYFVTIVSNGREALFGEISVGVGSPDPLAPDPIMRLNGIGEIVNKSIHEIKSHFQHVKLDEYIIMPNHIHAIIEIISDELIMDGENGSIGGTSQTGGGTVRTGGGTPPLRRWTLGQIIGYFKYQSTKRINAINDCPGMKIWQRNYYERIIRNENELHRIREYIKNNPANWKNDELFSS